MTKREPASAALRRSQLLLPVLLWGWRFVVLLGHRALPHVPERWGRIILTRLLKALPQLSGWSAQSERRHAAYSSYRLAFPHEDATEFMAALDAARASALATSMTHIARVQAGRESALVRPLTLTGGDIDPCVIAHLHYAIDPAAQLAVLAASTSRDLRWVVYPAQPTSRRWGAERSLLLAGRVPDSISQRMLYVTESSWLIEALRHVRHGGSLLVALDTLLDSHRKPSSSLRVGQITMPLSPAIELLVNAGEARLIFVWPQRRADNTWSLHSEQIADTAALASAAGTWIEENPLYWAGWPYLTWRLKRTDMHRRLVPM